MGEIPGPDHTIILNTFLRSLVIILCLATMARPKSLPDFAALLDASKPTPWKDHQRKKPSISLAAGLIMATTESPKSTSMPDAPRRKSSQGPEDWSENLFYAYAQKVYGPVSLPSLTLEYRIFRMELTRYNK